MEHDAYDRGSKWLIGHHGNSLLWLGGIRSIRSWRAAQAEVVQPKQLPDGLLEVRLRRQRGLNLFVVEIATYPDERAREQALADALLVFLDRGQLPDVLTVVLRPRGSVRLTDTHDLTSNQGWAHLQFRWRVVELWNMPAVDLLAANQVGLLPWVPLTQFDGPPEPLLRECRQRIDQQAPAEQRGNLLAVSQVLTRLRYNDEPDLLQIFGGSQAMIESPLIQELVAQTRHKAIVEFLEARFGTVPLEVSRHLSKILDEQRLSSLIVEAARCTDLAAFQAALTTESPHIPARNRRTGRS